MATSPSLDTLQLDETPRHSMDLERVISWMPPDSPNGKLARRTIGGQRGFLPRTDSLRDRKVRCYYYYIYHIHVRVYVYVWGNTAWGWCISPLPTVSQQKSLINCMFVRLCVGSRGMMHSS